MASIRSCRFDSEMMWKHGKRIGRIVCFAFVLVDGFASSAFADHPPRVLDITPRGLQIGGTTRVHITGEHLGGPVRFILSTATPLDVKQRSVGDDRVELIVRVDEAAEAGIYTLRIATPSGLSGPVMIGVDRLPQLEFRETLVALPVALHGRLSGNQIVTTQFTGRHQQHMVIDVEAQRLGERLSPALRLYSPNGRLIATARPSARIGGDARIDVQLPADGVYRLHLHDMVYKAAKGSRFRLKIGDVGYADVVYPLSVAAGVPTSVKMIGGRVVATGHIWPLASSYVASQSVCWPAGSHEIFTGAAPRVRLSILGGNEWMEEDVHADSSPLRAPIGISGCLASAGEHDEYCVRVHAGQKIRSEVHAHRWGSPLDAVLTVSDNNGETIVRADDQAGSKDPAAVVDVPDGVARLKFGVESLNRRGGPDYVYHLSVGPDRQGAPDVTMDLDCLNVPADGHVVVPMQIDHRGKPRRLRFDLSDSISEVIHVTPSEVDATDEVGLISFHAVSPGPGIFRASMLVNVLDDSSTRYSVVKTRPFPGTKYQPHLRDALMIAIVPSSPVRLSWPKISDPPYLALGTEQTMEIHVERAADDRRPVRLSLITSQRTPTKSVENRKVDDHARMLRLKTDVDVPAGEDSAEATLVIPADLPLHAWSYALKATTHESEEEKTLATAFSPVMRRPAIAPLRVHLESHSALSIVAGDATSAVIRGHVERHPDFVFPVSVSLKGLAKEDASPSVIIPEDERDFELKLKFAKQSTSRTINDAQLIAVPVDPVEAHRGIRGQSAEFTIEVTSAGG